MRETGRVWGEGGRAVEEEEFVDHMKQQEEIITYCREQKEEKITYFRQYPIFACRIFFSGKYV